MRRHQERFYTPALVRSGWIGQPDGSHSGRRARDGQARRSTEQSSNLTVYNLYHTVIGMAPASLADTYFSIPELMRLARGSYRRVIDAQYAARGIDDVPHPGGYLLAYLASGEESIPELIEGLGIRKRQYNDVVDSLVLRGYITRDIDPNSGRMSFALTERGRGAAEAILEGTRLVDEELARRLSPAEMVGLRRGLIALGEIKLSLPKQ
jgi:DNA-binding MarR family transcriptional regulator